ncbi:MAG: carboxyl transferase domain-containing protein [Peptostreptococcales bacterium]
MNKLEIMQYKKNKLMLGGGEKSIAKQHSKGKLTARERLHLLFDKDTFIETGLFVKHRCTDFGMEKVVAPAEGVITGYGQVNGRTVYAFAQDFTVMGGTLGKAQGDKIAKIMDMAIKTGNPIIGMKDSGGARIQEGIDSMSGYSNIFYRNTKASGVVPQITAIMGPCAGGAAYSPAITDYIFMVDKTSQMFIAGPEVIKAVTGEVIDGEKLGGGMTHNQVSGVAHRINKNDEECIEDMKRLLYYLPSNNTKKATIVESKDDINRKSEMLNTFIPEQSSRPYDMKVIIKELADDKEFYEIQPYFAQNIIIGFIKIGGETIGIVANQPQVLAGCMDINASDKAARFIRFCDAFNIQILNIVDVPGFLPGTNQEYSGIIRHGAKVLYAYSESTVGKVTLIVRKAYGGSYIAMCNKELGADFVYAWPGSEIAVMGSAGAANIIFKKEIENAEDPKKVRSEKIAEYQEKFANPYLAAEDGYVDDIIEPAKSRSYIASAFSLLRDKVEESPYKKHGNIPL